MPAAKLRPVVAQHDDHAAGHVFAAVVAAAFHHRDGTGVTDGEALAGNALEVGFTGYGAVEHGVADDDVLHRVALGDGRLTDDDATAGQALADIIVAVAGEVQRHAARQERGEALAGGSGKMDRDRVFRQADVAVFAGHLARQHGADGAVDVADRMLQPHRRSGCQRIRGFADQHLIQGLIQMVVLRIRCDGCRCRASVQADTGSC